MTFQDKRNSASCKFWTRRRGCLPTILQVRRHSSSIIFPCVTTAVLLEQMGGRPQIHLWLAYCLIVRTEQLPPHNNLEPGQHLDEQTSTGSQNQASKALYNQSPLRSPINTRPQCDSYRTPQVLTIKLTVQLVGH